MRLKWTNKPPNRTGIYWLKDKYTSAIICQVKCYKKETYVSFIRNEHAYVLDSNFTDVLWAGPIPMPKE